METDSLNDAQEMLENAGLKNVKGFMRRKIIGGTHEMCSARMGHSPKSSVLNK